MYNATQLRHFLHESVRGLARRKISGSVAVIIMGSALLTLALFSLVTINMDRFIHSIRGEIDMTVFLLDEVHPEDLSRLEGDLVSTVGVRAVRYVSADDALERFRVELGEDAQLLDALHHNPLPASFEIGLDPSQNSAERVEALARNLQQYPYVDEVLSDSAWVGRMERAGRIFVVVDLVVGLLVLVSALFVISNTVRLTIEESSQQVEIMKLVGATNWFIRAPYVMSGAFQGFAAGAVAMGVLLFAVRIVQNHVDGIFFFAGGQMLGFVILSTLLGAGGSMLALRRHLML
jgi:cell division transport system permease protein